MIRDTSVLLVLQTRTGTWAFPKGHLECDESTLSAATREIHEETGLSAIELVRYLCTYSRRSKKAGSPMKRIAMYLFRSGRGGIRPLKHDSLACEWVGLEDVPKRLSYSADAAFFSRHAETIRTSMRVTRDR